MGPPRRIVRGCETIPATAPARGRTSASLRLILDANSRLDCVIELESPEIAIASVPYETTCLVHQRLPARFSAVKADWQQTTCFLLRSCRAGTPREQDSWRLGFAPESANCYLISFSNCTSSMMTPFGSRIYIARQPLTGPLSTSTNSPCAVAPSAMRVATVLTILSTSRQT